MAEQQCGYSHSRWPAAATLLGAVLAVALPAVAQEVPQLTVGRLTGESRPTIDGHVEEAAWSITEPYSAFIQQEPYQGQPATELTEVWFLIDQTNLYVAVVCHDSEPDRLVVTQSRRDANLSHTDSIQILLDTFNDGQNAFVFGTNPFGIEYDGQVMGEGQTGGRGGGGGGGGSQRGQLRGFNANWDADWTVRARARERASVAGRPSSRSRSRRFGTRRARIASGESTSCATSGARTSRSSCRRCRAATRFIACRSRAS